MAEKQKDALLVAAIVCVLVGLFPQGESHRDPATDEQLTEWTLGFSFSPLWEYNKRQSPDGSFTWKAGFQFLSWSWIPIAAGAALLELWTRRRRKRKKVTTA